MSKKSIILVLWFSHPQGVGSTGVWQKSGFSAPQTHLWLIKVWFSASTFVVKIATFAKRQNVSGHCNGRHIHINKQRIIWDYSTF
jgi:hypothetical protein